MLNLQQFALAGKSTFTATSRATGVRFTFKVQTPKGKTNPHFVKVLTGPDNENHFEFLGTVFADGNYRHSRKSRINELAPSAKAWDWIHRNLGNQARLDEKMEIHHAGKCCRCGRKLTVPSSIESGVGPECASLMGLGA